MNSNDLDRSHPPSRDVAHRPEHALHSARGRVLRSSSRYADDLRRAEATTRVAHPNSARRYASCASHEQEYRSSTIWQYALLGGKARSVAPAIPGVMGEKEQYADL